MTPLSRTLLRICRGQAFILGSGGEWRSDPAELQKSLATDWIPEGRFYRAPVGSFLRVLGLFPVLLFGYVGGQLSAFLTHGRADPVGWLIVGAVVLCPAAIAAKLYIGNVCGPVVAPADGGFIAGSATEGLHMIRWSQIARWRRTRVFGFPTYTIDLGRDSPLATRRIVVNGDRRSKVA